MAQLTDLLNNIRKGNYKDANATIFDSLYLKIEESIEDRKEMSEASHDKDGDEYKKFFQSALKKFGVTSPGGLEGDKKKEFYNYVDKNWKSDKEKETGQDDPKESVELDERTKTRTYEFPDNLKAKQFAKDMANSGVATGTVSGNRVIDFKVLKGSDRVAQSTITRWLLKNKGKVTNEGAEMDIAKEKEKMAASQEKIRDFAIKMKKEKQRKRSEA